MKQYRNICIFYVQLHIYGQLIYGKMPTNTNIVKGWSLKKNVVLEHWIETQKKMFHYPYFIPCKKIILKWIDLNIRAKTIALQEVNLEENICDLSLGNDFSGHQRNEP